MVGWYVLKGFFFRSLPPRGFRSLKALSQPELYKSSSRIQLTFTGETTYRCVTHFAATLVSPLQSPILPQTFQSTVAFDDLRRSELPACFESHSKLTKSHHIYTVLRVIVLYMRIPIRKMVQCGTLSFLFYVRVLKSCRFTYGTHLADCHRRV